MTYDELDEQTQMVQGVVAGFQTGSAVEGCVVETLAPGDPAVHLEVTAVTGPEGLVSVDLTSAEGLSSEVRQCLQDQIWSVPSEGLPIDADLITVSEIEVSPPDAPVSHDEMARTLDTFRQTMPATIAAIREAYRANPAP